MVFISLLLLSTAAAAQTNSYLCLFADMEHTTWCAVPASIPGSFNMYIFALPNEDGLYCAEFQLIAPSDPTVILASYTPHPNMSIAQGHPSTGVTFCYLDCQRDWVWVYTVLVVVQSSNQNIIELAPHPQAGGPNFPSCIEPGRPINIATIYNKLYINYVDGIDPECDETATAEKTWGAIKSLYTQ
jgi:hypothetical protein